MPYHLICFERSWTFSLFSLAFAGCSGSVTLAFFSSGDERRWCEEPEKGELQPKTRGDAPARACWRSQRKQQLRQCRGPCQVFLFTFIWNSPNTQCTNPPETAHMKKNKMSVVSDVYIKPLWKLSKPVQWKRSPGGKESMHYCGCI